MAPFVHADLSHGAVPDDSGHKVDVARVHLSSSPSSGDTFVEIAFGRVDQRLLTIERVILPPQTPGQ